MSSLTKIPWADCTWNPTSGCSWMSRGCDRCWAEKKAIMLAGRSDFDDYRNGFEPTVHKHRLYIPTTWKEGKKVYVNSMGDLFHPDIPDEFIQDVIGVIKDTPQHSYFIMTKYTDEMTRIGRLVTWPDNLTMAVSMEDASQLVRLEALRVLLVKNRAAVFEPLLGMVGPIDLTGIDWVLAGGETGKGSRAMNLSWIMDIQKQCTGQGVPFTVTQYGTNTQQPQPVITP